MIVNSKTSIAWYTSIYGQNRYKQRCVNACDFRHIIPTSYLPTFQINTGQIGVSIVSWKVWCAYDNSLSVDLSSIIASAIGTPINAPSIGDFITFDGFTSADIVTYGLQFQCGSKYYMTIETNNNTYYSEIFESIDFTDNSLLLSSELPLFTAWRFYDQNEKAERFKNQCLAACNFYLIVQKTKLLPFMFRIPTTANIVDRFFIRDIDETCEYDFDISLINKTAVGSYDYVYYYAIGHAMDLPIGIYTCIVSIGGAEYTSEPINIICNEYVNPFEDYLQTDGGINITNDDGVQLLVD